MTSYELRKLNQVKRHQKAIEKTRAYKQDLFFNILFYASIIIIGLFIRIYCIMQF